MTLFISNAGFLSIQSMRTQNQKKAATLFATALFTGGGFQVLFSSFLGAIVIFAILLSLARIATRRDPKMLVFIIQAMSRTFRAEYDPCKYRPATVRRIRSRA